MTLLHIERQLKVLLSDFTPDADFEARSIILDIFGLTREQLIERYRDEADAERFASCLETVKRRTQGEPLQYILGKAFFMGLEFKVCPDCLIPRWDTENAVTFAASTLPAGAHFADIGTGSGCIAVSLLKAREDACGDAYDISSSALDIAKLNARRHEVDDRLCLSLRDLKSGAPEEYTYDMIISNPPYISTSDIPGLAQEVRREPILALDGGEDGLDFYRYIISGWTAALKSCGYFVFEVGCNQAESVKGLLRDICSSTGSIKDINGIDRIVYGIKK